MNVKSLMKDILGPVNVGRLDYVFRPRLLYAWGGPFNGQEYRQRIYNDILERVQITAIVETGTFRGTTTALFAKSGVPVYSAEVNPRYYGYVSTRFYQQREIVRLFCEDSREFLRRLRDDVSVPKERVFFYLDAHWEDDLPLSEELCLVFQYWTEPIIMIDDFQVPGTDYRFDDYGQGMVLNLAYLEEFAHFQFSAFFPAAGASEETGKKKGCAVLCKERHMAQILDQVPTLTQFNELG